MHALLNPIIIVLLFVCVRCADLAISSRGDLVRVIAYGIVALLALIALILALIV